MPGLERWLSAGWETEQGACCLFGVFVGGAVFFCIGVLKRALCTCLHPLRPFLPFALDAHRRRAQFVDHLKGQEPQNIDRVVARLDVQVMTRVNKFAEAFR